MAKVTHVFKCSCENKTEMIHTDFIKHLVECHGLKTNADREGKREMIMHMDGAKFFQSTYKWTLKN
jgi:hypothetical protein